ncbi:hypothetical protein G5I_10195 [Acromyrmex echinatior]|uniref:Uncharacterized protein n=1 Tax=Acromyrmex echinatior TaxID=103372 RepID=F4WW41_ACREC|nr:hypothetical protein G5I_10195 [Acromyrmex echinatior]
MAVKGRGHGFTAIKVSRCVTAVPKLPPDRPEIMRRQSHPRAFFDLITGRKVVAAAHRRSNGSDTLSNIRLVHTSRYTAMHVARSDRERLPPRVPPLSRNAISRPFTTNVSDARIVYVTRGADVPKAGGDFFPWVSESAMCTSHLLRSARYEIRK